MDTKLVYRFIFSLIITAFILTCDDLERDNLLDPKNPSGHTDRMFLVEAFVNTSPDIPESQRFSFRALEALDDIKRLYGNRVLIAEYHRSSKTPGYMDSLDLEGRYESLYERYVTENGSGQKGVPDIFLNGSDRRVQGAYDAASVKERLVAVLSPLISGDGYFLLEAEADVDTASDNTRITVTCRVARLGNSLIENLRLRLIFLRNLGADQLKRVVVAEDEIGKYTETTGRIGAGEYGTVRFESILFTKKPDAVILALTSSDETEVHTCIKVDL